MATTPLQKAIERGMQPAALPFVGNPERDQLFGLAMDHPDAGVQIEAAWASAKLGSESALRVLARYCLELNTLDGKVLATNSRIHGNYVLQLWDATSTPPRVIGNCYEGTQITSIAFSPDGQTLAAACHAERCLRLWDVSQREPRQLGPPRTQSDGAWSVAFCPNGNTMAVASGQRVRMWAADTEEPLERHEREGHTLPVTSVAFSTDGNLLVSLSKEERAVRLWYLGGIQPKETAVLSTEGGALCFAGSGKVLVTCSGPGLRVWNVGGAHPVEGTALACNRQSERAGPLAVSPDGKVLAVAAYKGRVSSLSAYDVTFYVWQGNQFVKRYSLPGDHLPWEMPATFSPDGKRLAIHNAVVDLSGSEPVYQHIPLHGNGFGAVFQLAFGPDGRELISSKNQSAQHWILDGTKPVEIKPGSRPSSTKDSPPQSRPPSRWHKQHEWTVKGVVGSVSFAPDGRKAAAADDHGFVTVWELHTGQQLHELELPVKVHGIAFAPDSRHLATANADGTIYILRLPK
jgi:WD40 repeat protein